LFYIFYVYILYKLCQKQQAIESNAINFHKKYEVFFRIAEGYKKAVKASKRLKSNWTLTCGFQAQFMPLAIGQWNFIV